jgi:aquaporin Z
MTMDAPKHSMFAALKEHWPEYRPGPTGQAIAFLAGFLISFGLMLAVLITSNTRRAARFTGLFAGALIAIYIVVEAPYSGMSMNPERTFASAMPAKIWTGLWLYFAAPLLGMMLAGKVYLLSFGRVYCAKLHHDNDKRCIFHPCALRDELDPTWAARPARRVRPQRDEVKEQA